MGNKLHLRKENEETRRIYLPTPSPEDMHPPEPPSVPSAQRGGAPSRVVTWLVVTMLILATGGFINYVFSKGWIVFGPQGREQRRDLSNGGGDATTTHSIPEQTIAPVERSAHDSHGVWPHIRISGILSIGESGAMAHIGGNMYKVGDKIEGIRIIDIDANEVVLEYKGEQRRLSAGQCTR